MPKRKNQPVTSGYIDPNRVYVKEGCMKEFGLGSESLAMARQSGIVKPMNVGNRNFYKGSEIIAWLEQESKKRSASA